MCTVADVKAALEIQSDTSRDGVIQTYITDASAIINRFCERAITPLNVTATTHRFYVDESDMGGYVAEFIPFPLQAVSGAGVVLNAESGSGTTLTANVDYLLDPLNSVWGIFDRIYIKPTAPVFSQTALNFGRALVDVTGTWGFNAVPPNASTACIQTVRSWLDRGVSQTASADVADLPRGMAPAGDASYALPGSALRLLQPLKRWVP